MRSIVPNQVGLHCIEKLDKQESVSKPGNNTLPWFRLDFLPELPKSVVLNLWVPTPLGVTY